MQVVGATQKGKTTYGNKLHRTFPGISIFYDYKAIDPLWGFRVHRLDNIAHVLPISTKLVYQLPRTEVGIQWDVVDQQNQALWAKFQRVAQQSRWKSGPYLWYQKLYDEAGKYQDDGDSDRPQTIEDESERMLGLGGRMVTLQQHPGTLNTHTRNNLDIKVVFGLGDEGRRCIKGWGWPEDGITPWTDRPYHFATKHPVLGWRLHCPTPRRQACSVCGRLAGEGPRNLGS